MATPYQNIAKSALMNWNGISEEEATQKIENETVHELESQVYAMGSIKYAVLGIANQVGLTSVETEALFEAVVNGPEDAGIFNIIAEKTKGFTEQQKLGVLSTIHDGWVTDNSSEKTFNKKVDRKQLRQYAPLELIGWNETKSDLLFLTPILNSVGVEVNEEQLSDAYHEKAKSYIEEKGLSSEEDLTFLIQQGTAYYPALSKELEARLLPRSEEIALQIIENWRNKDPKTMEAYTASKVK